MSTSTAATSPGADRERSAAMRARLAARLPDMLAAALTAYQAGILDRPPPEDARELNLHQTAAKSALKHVEMILKLAETAFAEGGASPEGDMGSLLRKARAALARDAEALGDGR